MRDARGRPCSSCGGWPRCHCAPRGDGGDLASLRAAADVIGSRPQCRREAKMLAAWVALMASRSDEATAGSRMATAILDDVLQHLADAPPTHIDIRGIVGALHLARAALAARAQGDTP